MPAWTHPESPRPGAVGPYWRQILALPTLAQVCLPFTPRRVSRRRQRGRPGQTLRLAPLPHITLSGTPALAAKARLTLSGFRDSINDRPP